MMNESQYSATSSTMMSQSSSASVKESYSNNCGFLGLPELRDHNDIPHNTQVSGMSYNQQSIRESDATITSGYSNISDLSNTSLSRFDEGDFDEDLDRSELIPRVWEHDKDKISLPIKFKKELKKKVIDILDKAYKAAK